MILMALVTAVVPYLAVDYYQTKQAARSAVEGLRQNLAKTAWAAAGGRR
jgi:hypothetical protein